jgi:transforming growth factor-beta-induced protein
MRFNHIRNCSYAEESDVKGKGITLIVSAMITVMVLCAGCASQQPAPMPSMTPGASTSPGEMKNILATLEADGRFTTFVTAVKAADLNDMLSGDTLSGTEMYTVFAPTDDAFRTLSEGSMDTFLKDPQGDLLQILLYHVVPGKVTAADLGKLTSVETLQGGALPISVSNGIMMAGGANVLITDIECSNGVIHVVDTVMLPPA